jgi:8-oxo-dGTP pyrophosphatase MutT (NUDIX family)
MKVSAGFIIECYGRWLVAHVTNGKNWDFPKGGVDPGETNLEAAVREVMEETSFDLKPYLHHGVVDYGQHPYINGKQLHLFGIQVPEIDVNLLECTEFVERGTYRFPECDAFMLISPARREDYLNLSMQKWVNAHVMKE